MKKIVAISLLVCLAIAMVYVSAMAQGNGYVVVNPYYWDSSTEVSTDTTIILGIGWAACRRGPIQPFLKSVHMYWSIEGGSVFAPDVDINQYWSSIYERPPHTIVCMGKTPETVWATYWNYSLGTLAPGEYEVYFDWWLDHPVTDLADSDGDGKPDIFRDLGDKTITIRVVE